MFAGDLGEILQLGQFQAQHRTPLLALAGEEPCFVIVEPHLDIVTLWSDSCLSTPNLFLASVAHRGLELFHDKLDRCFADASASGSITEFESLPVVAQLPVEGGRDRLQFEQAALTLDHDGCARFGEGGSPDVESVERLAALTNCPQQGIALFQEVRVTVQLARVVGIDLREQRVEEAAASLPRPFDQLQVVGPEEHDPERADHIARPPGNAVDGEPAGRAGGGTWTDADPDLQRPPPGVGLDAAADARCGLTESNQFRRLLRPRRAGQGQQRDGLEQIGLALRIPTEEHRGGPLQRQVQLCVVAKVEK